MIYLKGLAIAFGAIMFMFGGGQKSEEKAFIVLNSSGVENKVRMHFIDDNGDKNMRFVLEEGGLEFNPDDFNVGETKTFTLDNGDEVEVRREQNKIVLILGEKEMEFFIGEIGEAGHGVHVYKAASTALEMVSEGAEDALTISGLGDVDEETRERIINALREAGVSKEVRFSSMGGLHHGGENLIWIEEDGNNNENVKVIKCKGKDGTHIKIKNKLIIVEEEEELEELEEQEEN